MADLLIRNIEPGLERRIEARAQAHGRAPADEAKDLIRKGLDVADSHASSTPKANAAPGPETMGMGTWMSSLVRPEDRGDDLVFEVKGDMPEPPDFG